MYNASMRLPDYTGSSTSADEGDWRLPVLDTCLWIGAVLGSLWMIGVLIAYPAVATSPEFVAVLPGFVAAWTGAIFRRLVERTRVALLLFFCLSIMAVTMEAAGLKPAAVVMTILFDHLATLYRGKRVGWACTGAALLVYALVAVGRVRGVFPVGSAFGRADPSEGRYWLPAVVVVFLGAAAVGEIVVSVLAHASKALKQARESEEKFAKAFRASPDAIVISELATGRIIDINEACERLFAVTREATIGNTSLEMGLWVDPNERARLASLLARDGSVRGFQCHGRRSDGTVSFFEAAVETIELQGKPSLVGIIHDITETKRAEEGLRESEAKLRAMFEGSRDAIGVARKGVHVFANAAYLKLFGFESNERIVGTMILDSIAPSHREQVAQFVQRRSAGELIPKVYESRGIRVDGTEFDAEFSVSTYELNGEIYSMAHIRDITDRRLAAEAKARLEEQLRRSQKLEAIGTLASGIAHDFNNILTGIYAYTSLARETAAGNAELCDYLDEIRLAGNRAADLVRQILAFSRKGGGDEAFGPVQLGHIVSEALKLLRASSPSTIAFSKHLAAELPALRGNATQLHQVVMNLGTNAVQAMLDHPGQLTVSLDLCAVDERMAETLPGLRPGPHVRLTVADTGRGMDAVTQERVFEPFFTTKAPGEGTGLGLSVVHGIVYSHHGAIRMSSEINRGTTFEIFLPAASAPLEERLEPSAVPRGHSERILFVDDEEPIMRVGELALRKLGYAVEAESQVLVALERLRSDPFAFRLVVSDQTMPVMTGVEFARRIHEFRSDLPVVLASGHSVAIAPERIQAAGVCEILSKPYTVEMLAAAVSRNLPRPPLGNPE